MSIVYFEVADNFILNCSLMPYIYWGERSVHFGQTPTTARAIELHSEEMARKLYLDILEALKGSTSPYMGAKVLSFRNYQDKGTV